MRDNTKSFPLASTLQDLAILRASGTDLTPLSSQFARPNSVQAKDEAAVDVDAALAQSREYVSAARMVLKLAHGAQLEKTGEEIEQLIAIVEGVQDDVKNIRATSSQQPESVTLDLDIKKPT